MSNVIDFHTKRPIPVGIKRFDINRAESGSPGVCTPLIVIEEICRAVPEMSGAEPIDANHA